MGTGALAAPRLTATQASSPVGLRGAVIASPGAAVYGYATTLVVITQGSPLSFINLDQVPHTLTSTALNNDGDPLFSVSAHSVGGTSGVYGASNLAPGTYNFYCQFHPNMKGQLLVEGSQAGGLSPSKPKFEQPLRIPPVLTGANLTIPVEEADVQVTPRGDKTVMWTYGGSYPGPTIRRPAGKDTKVTFVNQLPQTVGDISVHLHGDHHDSASDGQPDAELIAPGAKKTYDYPLTESGKPETSAFDFYHDHRMGETSRNNWNGLQGMFIVDDPAEAKLGLPSGNYDVPLMVADRSLDRAHQLTEPFTRRGDGTDTFEAKLTGPYAPPGDATVGSRVIVNGQINPYFRVEARRYRLRLLDASDFQSFDFALSDGSPFEQVGTGTGLLTKPVTRDDILLGPSERADVIVDFSKLAGQQVTLDSIPRSDNYPGGIGTADVHLMQFRVGKATADKSHVPTQLTPLPKLAIPALPTKAWTFSLGVDASVGPIWEINGRAFDPHRVDADIPLGSTQRWMLTNLSPITHYIHLHEEQWRTVSRDGRPPPAWEAGYKDTWRLDPGETVEVAAKFTDYTGAFMLHCHMLDHEDHGMMAHFNVTPAGSKFQSLPPALGTPGRGDAQFVPGVDDHLGGAINPAALRSGDWPAAWWCRLPGQALPKKEATR